MKEIKSLSHFPFYLPTCSLIGTYSVFQLPHGLSKKNPRVTKPALLSSARSPQHTSPTPQLTYPQPAIKSHLVALHLLCTCALLAWDILTSLLRYAEQDIFSCNKVHWLKDFLSWEHSERGKTMFRLSAFGLIWFRCKSYYQLNNHTSQDRLVRGSSELTPKPMLPRRPARASITFQDSHKQRKQQPNGNQGQTTGTTLIFHSLF